MNDYQRTIFTMKYAKSLPGGAREDWSDTTARVTQWLANHPGVIPNSPEAMGMLVRAHMDIEEGRVVPSMRLMSSAGPALDRENLTAFNCMFMGIDGLLAFSRLMYALMCGTGVGFSVETLYTKGLPPVHSHIEPMVGDVIEVPDTRAGWASSFYLWIFGAWVTGCDRELDYSLIRPKGAPLQTTGGYASGPEPLKDLVEFTRGILYEAQGRHLSSLEIYDICTKIADVVVMGGVRRAATICLFDYLDTDMWLAKTPQGGLLESPHRHNSNNSVVFPDEETARNHIDSILTFSQTSGEPGFVVKSTLMEKLRKTGRPVPEDGSIGLNPCGEIILRNNQVCNLTEVILRPEYTLEENMEQVETAVFLGLLQSKLTSFNEDFLYDTRVNTEAERLLGVSLSGIFDDPQLLEGDMEALQWLREYAHDRAKYWSTILGVECPKAITCVKPSGTVSKIMDCSPGVHPRISHRYLSNIGVPRHTPMCNFLLAQGQPIRHMTNETVVFSFPQEAPEGAMVAGDLSAVEHLRIVLDVNKHWCDHNASATIYVGNDEWVPIGELLRERVGEICGITFLPRIVNTGAYPYMPLEEVVGDLPQGKPLDWLKYAAYDDSSFSTKGEFACMGGSCEITV